MRWPFNSGKPLISFYNVIMLSSSCSFFALQVWWMLHIQYITKSSTAKILYSFFFLLGKGKLSVCLTSTITETQLVIHHLCRFHWSRRFQTLTAAVTWSAHLNLNLETAASLSQVPSTSAEKWTLTNLITVGGIPNHRCRAVFGDSKKPVISLDDNRQTQRSD